MRKDTNTAFDLLGQLPPEIRSMIFGHMIQRTVRLEYPSRRSNLVLDIQRVNSHLKHSPWVTLNKQYCVEYLRVFLKQVELREQIEKLTGLGKWARIRDGKLLKRDRKAIKALGAPCQVQMLAGCLQTIDLRLRIATSQVNLKEPIKELSTFTRSICVFYYDVIFRYGYGWAQHAYRPFNITRSLQQLRRHHEKYNIPANKISFHMYYGSPRETMRAFASYQDKPYREYFDPDLPSVQPRIWVADHDKSVAAMDEEIQVLRRALEEKLKEIERLYTAPNNYRGGVEQLEAWIERDISLLRKIHLRTIDEVKKSWKAQDGWYELDDMFRIAEAWKSEQKD